MRDHKIRNKGNSRGKQKRVAKNEIGKKLLILVKGIDPINERFITPDMISPAEWLENEERFRIIADTSYDWEAWILPDGSYGYVSPACERITGYSPGEFLNNPNLIFEIVHPEDRVQLVDHLCKHLDHHDPTSEVELRIINKGDENKDGEVRWIWHQCHSVFSPDGRWMGRRATNRDVTLLKKAERELRQEQQLFNAGPTVIFRWKAAEGWPVEYVSANVQEVFGYTPALPNS